MIKNSTILILFNARWEDCCDYAQQTLRLLASSNRVIAVPLAHEQSLWQFLSQWVRSKHWTTAYSQARVFTPIIWLPFRRFAVVAQINHWINAGFLRGLLALEVHPKHSASHYVWFFEPHHILTWLQWFSQWWSVYDCVDFWPGFGGKVAAAHRQLVKTTTTMVVNSEALLQATVPIRPTVRKVPLGFATKEFGRLHRRTSERHTTLTQLKALKASGKQVVGFVGHIGNRFDFPWLLRIMQAFPTVTFVFVGPVWVWRDIDDTAMKQYFRQWQALPNCLLLPPVTKTVVSQVIRLFDVGLIPYTTKEIFNANCHPMKLYEYWWWRKPVLATAIVELQLYPDLLCATNQTTQAIRWLTTTLQGQTQTQQVRARLKQLAVANSWEAKLTAISQVILAHQK